MHIRPLQLSDLPYIADFSARTQLEDEVVDFIAPGRHKYYTSYRNGFVRRIHARSLRPGWMMWVAETDEDDEPTTTRPESRLDKGLGGRVVGYSAWTRVGSSPIARNWQKINEGWLTKLESRLAELKNKYWAFFKLDWSEDNSKRPILNQLFDKTFDEGIFPEAWLLANLAVDKDYQRQGIGALLVKWGLDQAEAERVPCGVESSVAGLRLYEKMGFRTFRNWRYGEKEKEIMPEMVWEPSGMKGHWFDRAKTAVDIDLTDISKMPSKRAAERTVLRDEEDLTI